MSGSLSGYGGGDGSGSGEGRERGARRKKLAGYWKAANEIRQSYQQSYSEKWGSANADFDDDPRGIPGSFPDVSIVSHGDEQLILFPSYAKRHTKEAPNPDLPRSDNLDTDGPGDAEYWAREWQKFEDDRAIIDVDVRGWIYSPHKGPLNRKNRMLIGLARQLSGIPAPRVPSRDQSPDSSSSLRARHREHESRRDQERIEQEADQILRKGQGEQRVAAQGGYSERPGRNNSDSESLYGNRSRSRSRTPSHTPNGNAPGPDHLSTRPSWNQPSDMTQAELTIANSHLMTRLRPFLTNPLVSTPITLFFFNEKTSVSRTVTTNEAGHFTIRAALDFLPTQVRVLASENLSATADIKITEPKGVSLITDVDDTIKHTSIGSGVRETFRNSFIRDLEDLTIDGVKEWYNTMYDMGVGIHYVSNSPWQLFPVLVSFFRLAGLPPGSYHLKQYSGMLQGIFEPVAERKKGTLERIMKDFPERRFILIGDSGEADLEVYTDVALAHPGKILAIFIRDVTTPPTQGFFDSAMGPLSDGKKKGRVIPSPSPPVYNSRLQTPKYGTPENRPALPPRAASEVKIQTSDGPTMGNLVDLGDDLEEENIHKSHHRVMPRSASSLETLQSLRRASDGTTKVPPPRPAKPLALRGVTTDEISAEGSALASTNRRIPPPPPPRRSNLQNRGSQGPQADASEGYLASARDKVSAAYNALPEVRAYMPGRGYSHQSIASSNSSDKAPPPSPRRDTNSSSIAPITNRLSWNSTDSSDDELNSNRNNNVPINKKLDLWKRRWKSAKQVLDAQGVPLRSWRVGGDICIEAVQMIEKNMKEMGVEGYGKDDPVKGKAGQGGEEVKVKNLKR